MSNVKEYYQNIGDGHRKKFGQFFTHPDVAQFMTEWVLGSGQKNIYDPAFGLGAFYLSILSIQNREDINFYGSEIDPTILDFGLDLDLSIKNEDYLLAWGKQHQNIVCNPPYMRFQKFLNRDRVAKSFQENLEIKLSGYTNTASAFLLKSLSEIDGTGRLAYVMPLEFLNTGYGKMVKERLLSDKHLVSIIKLDCEKDIFPDATTSVGIILYDSSQKYDAVNFYSLDSMNLLKDFTKLLPTKVILTNELNSNTKWLPYFQKNELIVENSQLVALSDYGKFSRGIATGANEFFVLKPSDVKQQFLLETECLPCITRSSQVKKPVFELDDYQELVSKDSPVYLFAANEQHSKAADRYIQYGVSQKFDQRFLTKSRNPWYKTEKRQPSRLLLGVFSRGGYKVVLNRTNALNLTCFHGFQPNLFGIEQIEKLFLYLSSQVGRQIISLSMRKYGDNLDKFEPNDLNMALVPSPKYFEQMPDKLVKEAIALIEKTSVVPQNIDEYFATLAITSIGG